MLFLDFLYITQGVTVQLKENLQSEILRDDNAP